MNVKSCIALLAAMTLVCIGLSVFSREIHWRDLADAKSQLARASFYCISDRADGTIALGGFMVSRDPMTWQEVTSLSKVGPMGPKWKRMAWVTLRDSYLGDLMGIPDGADVRVWGNVYIVGDHEFVDEVEQALRGHNRRN